jgi:Domain of unknown function (DUF5671)
VDIRPAVRDAVPGEGVHAIQWSTARGRGFIWKGDRHVATAKRLYLYVVSAAGLMLLISGAVVLLRELLNKLGVGPQGGPIRGSVGGYNPDLDAVSQGVALGLVGLVVWLIHWSIAERKAGWTLMGSASTSDSPDAAAAERRSIVRSVFLAIVMGAAIAVSATVAVDLAGRVIADALGATQSYMSYSLGLLDDAWSVAILIVLLGVWRYYTWIRSRDVRQGPVLTGAAAWVSRTYLYGIAFLGLTSALQAVAALINTVAIQIASPNANGFAIPLPVDIAPLSPSGNGWERPAIAALVGIAVWGAVWLSHWLYSSRLRSGSSDQSAAERVSRVRLAFLMVVVLWSVTTVVSGFGSGLDQALVWAFGLNNGPTAGNSLPPWYLILVPPIAAVPAALAWWWHRRRAFTEAPDGPVGYSAIRVAGYVTALVGLTALATGVAEALATLFGQWFATVPVFDVGGSPLWQWELAASAALAIVGLAVWFWPWLYAQRRRGPQAAERPAEIRSSSRAYYLYLVAGAAVLIGAVTLAWVLYHYLRLGFGLDESGLGSEVSGPIAALLVAAALLAYHALTLRSDRTAAAGPTSGAIPWPTPGPVPAPEPAVAPAPGPAVAPTPAPEPVPEQAPPEEPTANSGG